MEKPKIHTRTLNTEKATYRYLNKMRISTKLNATTVDAVDTDMEQSQI